MKTLGIITAMKEEADLIIEKYSLELLNKKGILEIFSWKYYEKNIILILWWIWKIQSAFATTHLFENYKIDTLINIGIAWNISKNIINIGDVILPTKFIQHDIYLPFPWEHLNYAKSEINILSKKVSGNNNFKIHNNLRCLTWDQFIDDEKIIGRLKEQYDWDLVEMEAYSILSITKNYSLLDNTIVIKWISDWANNEAIDSHMSNLEVAMKNSIVALDEVILQLT